MAQTLGDVYLRGQQDKTEDANAPESEGKYLKKVGSTKHNKCKVPIDTYDGKPYGDIGDQWQCKCGIRWKLERRTVYKKWSRFVRDLRKSHGKRMQVIDALVGKG